MKNKLPPPVTLAQHLSRAALARWSKATPEQKTEHAKMMNAKRWKGHVKKTS